MRAERAEDAEQRGDEADPAPVLPLVLKGKTKRPARGKANRARVR